MIEQLFGSKTRVKLLGLFYQNPNRSFYVREITRKIDEQINSVRRELANLLSIGIIKSDNSNNKLYYEVDQSFEYYEALEAMFGLNKKKRKKSTAKQNDGNDANEVSDLAESSNDQAQTGDENIDNILRSGNVRMLIYTGQFTRDNQAGVDVVVVGDINLPNLEHAIEKLEAAEKKEVRYSVFTPEEFNYRKQVNDRFIANLLLSKKIVHIDREKYL